MQEKKNNPLAQKMPAKVIQEQGRVVIEFDESIPKNVVKEQIESCETGTCECCTPEFREQVDGFKVIDKEKSVDVEISGPISAKHVRENLIACAPKLKKEN